MKQYGIFYFDKDGIHPAFPLLDGLIAYDTFDEAEARSIEIAQYMRNGGELLPLTVLPLYS